MLGMNLFKLLYFTRYGRCFTFSELCFSIHIGYGVKFCHTRYRKKPQFGTRFLKDPSKIYEFNAWYELKCTFYCFVTVECVNLKFSIVG